MGRRVFHSPQLAGQQSSAHNIPTTHNPQPTTHNPQPTTRSSRHVHGQAPCCMRRHTSTTEVSPNQNTPQPHIKAPPQHQLHQQYQRHQRHRQRHSSTCKCKRLRACDACVRRLPLSPPQRTEKKDHMDWVRGRERALGRGCPRVCAGVWGCVYVCGVKHIDSMTALHITSQPQPQPQPPPQQKTCIIYASLSL